MTSISIWQLMAVIFLGPLGQLYVRIFALQGSLDKAWLMLLSVPPLSLIPGLMMYFGRVADGEGGKPYDWYMLAPIILTMIGSFAADKLDDMDYNIFFQMIARMVIPLAGGITAFYIRDKTNCNQKRDEYLKNNPDGKYEQNSMIMKSVSNALIAQGWAVLINTLVYYIPYVGTALTVLAYIPMMEYIILAIIYSTIYILINMFNNRDAQKYCEGNANGTARNIFTIIGLILIILNELKDTLGDMIGISL